VASPTLAAESRRRAFLARRLAITMRRR
jgi:hypothetical protein